MKRIKPIKNAYWEEDPVLHEGHWCGRYRYISDTKLSGPEECVDVCEIKAPSKYTLPVEINGIWYWKYKLMPLWIFRLILFLKA